jgi:hypothetical protein
LSGPSSRRALLRMLYVLYLHYLRYFLYFLYLLSAFPAVEWAIYACSKERIYWCMRALLELHKVRHACFYSRMLYLHALLALLALYPHFKGRAQ